MFKLNKPTTLVLGTARSGTTWLAQVLSKTPRYRLLFEPFHTEYFEKANLVADKYFSETPSPTIQKYIHQHISDKVNDDWILQNVSKNIFIRRNPFWATHIICKDIRTILLIPIYYKMYGNQVKIICITRDPYYVINSMFRAKFPWTFKIDNLLNQAALEEKYGIPLSKLKKFANSDLERLTIRWLIENMFLEKIKNEIPIYLTYYENLKKDPIHEFKNIGDFANIVLAKNVWHDLEKPSYTTSTKSPIFTSANQHYSNKNNHYIDRIFNEVDFNYPNNN